MANRACQTIGADIFNTANIKSCEAYVHKMQRKLDKAVASGDVFRIRWYVHLLSKCSRAVKILAVYHVTSENDGKYTAGVDGIAIKRNASKGKKDYQRRLLLKEIDVQKKPSPIRRVFIPKSNGKMRPLGIPTMANRIAQDIIRMSIEPIAESHFQDNSYGFRPKRSCHDAIEHLFQKLKRKGCPQWIIEGDISGCFDNISHEQITKTMLNWHIPKKIVDNVRKMLKANLFFNGKLLDVETGTPQGGILSPMLANIALTALDDYCEKYAKRTKEGKQKGRYRIPNPIVRYADDFVIVCKTKEEAETRKDEIGKFLLNTIGLTLSPEKTTITNLSEGFNFLGFNIRKYTEKNPRSKYHEIGKLLIKPQKEKVLKFLGKVQAVLNKNKTAKVDSIIHLLNPMLRGFALYYRFAVSKEIFVTIDKRVWEMLWRWAKRRHPNKTLSWIRKRYFIKKGQTWIFTDKEKLQILNIAPIPIVRFTIIKKGMRVYGSDEQTSEYWKQRAFANALSNVYSVKVEKLMSKQKGKCAGCGQLIENVADTHVHHMRPRSEKGTDEPNNLKLLHQSCHTFLHTVFTREAL